MSKENEALDKKQNGNDFIAHVSTSAFNNLILPVEMIWKPKEDITTYELAMCLPYFFRRNGVMPFEIDKSLSYFRHFEIIDHNIQ